MLALGPIAGALIAAEPAAASGGCGSGFDLGIVSAGAFTDNVQDHWWRFNAGVTTLYELVSVAGDFDLIIWDESCTVVECESATHLAVAAAGNEFCALPAGVYRINVHLAESLAGGAAYELRIH
jgi:hypothetical protein